MENRLLGRMRAGGELSLQEQLLLIFRLSLPAVLAQISSILMEYIDAAMVGRLGAGPSAAIGVVGTSTWLLGGVTIAATTGFTVLTAQEIGAQNDAGARRVMRQGFIVSLAFALALSLLGVSICRALPGFFGAESAIRADAAAYFGIFAAFLPVMQANRFCAGQLQASGNLRTPSLVLAAMCALDILFNALLIFPAGTIRWGRLSLPGAGLGVAGAALGTGLAEAAATLLLFWALFVRSPQLHLRRGERLRFERETLRRSRKIALPVVLERFVMAGATVAVTAIVAPLGTVALAADTFGVTAESLCYMPGYGVQSAASTLVGQSVGAGRRQLALRFGRLTVAFGMVLMAATGVLLWLFAPWMMGILTPDPDVVALGVRVLRIEAFAEPMFAASIVANGVFQGAGTTLPSTLMNFGSLWGVRVPLAKALAPRYGLVGVWAAMCLELIVRGTLFLIRLLRGRWVPLRGE